MSLSPDSDPAEGRYGCYTGETSKTRGTGQEDGPGWGCFRSRQRATPQPSSTGRPGGTGGGLVAERAGGNTPPLIEGTAGWYGIPAPPQQNLTRHRLLDLLDGADHLPLILVSAPAGSGKTSLVAEWVATRGDRQNTGWIRFESADESFWPGLVGCLERLGVVIADRTFPDAAVALDRSLLGSLAAAVA